MQNKSIFIAAAFALFAVSAVAGYYGLPLLTEYRLQKQKESFIPPAVPVLKAKAFAAEFNNFLAATEPQSLPDEAFTAIDGRKIRFSDYKGKPLLVNFWATWCTPCIVELPSLENLGNHYRGQMNVIAVALEHNRSAKDIADFLESRDLGDFAGYIDEGGELGKKLGLYGIPTSFMIGSDGLILYRFEGDADWMSEDALAFFDIFLLQKR